jgi:putative transposase
MCAQQINLSDTLFEDEFAQLEMPYEGDIVSSPIALDAVFDCYSSDLRNEALRRLSYIEWFERNLSAGWTKNNINALMDDASKYLEEPLPNWRTIVHWRQRYYQQGKKLVALIPRTNGKGNRSKRLDSRDEIFVKEAISSFLDKKKPTIAKAYKNYKDKICVLNFTNDSSSQIKLLSYNSFYKRVLQSDIYKYVCARDGKYKADVEFNSYGAYIPPSYVMERVQIDHTTLDLVLLHDELLVPIGRPSITVLLDAYSHCIVGFNLNFRQPSYESVRNALLNTIYPKGYIAQNYPDIQHEWPCCGKPHTLVVDNGVEFWSTSLEHACKDANINIQYNPVRKPWLKPLIERFFGILNGDLLSSIPGKTFSNILEKGDYDSYKEAGMRFSVFLELFHHWIIDIYHQDADSRQRYIPILSWVKGCNILPPPEIIGEDLEELTIKLGMSFWATHRKGGVYKNHLRYESNELAAYRMHYPASTKGRRKVLVKLNPQDISYIYVLIDEIGKLIRVPCIDPTGETQGLSLDAHLISVKLHRDYIGSKIDVISLSKSRLYINQRIERELDYVKNASRNKMKALNKIAKFQGMGSQPVEISNTESVPYVQQLEKLAINESAITNLEDDWDGFTSGLEPY